MVHYMKLTYSKSQGCLVTKYIYLQSGITIRFFYIFNCRAHGLRDYVKLRLLSRPFFEE